MVAKKNLGNVLVEQIAEQVFQALKLPLAQAAKVDDMFDKTLAPVIITLGRAVEARLNVAIKSKYPDGI